MADIESGYSSPAFTDESIREVPIVHQAANAGGQRRCVASGELQGRDSVLQKTCSARNIGSYNRPAEMERVQKDRTQPLEDTRLDQRVRHTEPAIRIGIETGEDKPVASAQLCRQLSDLVVELTIPDPHVQIVSRQVGQCPNQGERILARNHRRDGQSDELPIANTQALSQLRRHRGIERAAAVDPIRDDPQTSGVDSGMEEYPFYSRGNRHHRVGAMKEPGVNRKVHASRDHRGTMTRAEDRERNRIAGVGVKNDTVAARPAAESSKAVRHGNGIDTPHPLQQLRVSGSLATNQCLPCSLSNELSNQKKDLPLPTSPGSL